MNNNIIVPCCNKENKLLKDPLKSLKFAEIFICDYANQKISKYLKKRKVKSIRE